MSTLKYISGPYLMTFTLGGAYTPADGIMTLTGGQGARLPATGDFWIRPTSGTLRVFKVTANAADVLTVAIVVAYGADDTAFGAGTEFKWALTAEALDQLRADLVQTGADASKAAAKAGSLYLPNNGVQLYRDTGAAMAPWGPVFPFTSPVDGDFSWINQGTASVTTTQGGIFLRCPKHSGWSIAIRKISAPATPWVVTAALIPQVVGSDVHNVGLCFRQSSDGKFSVLALTPQGYPAISADSWTNPTTFSAVKRRLAYQGSVSPVWFRLADNGTDRIYSYSPDGQNWIVYYSVGRTDFLTADEVGFYAGDSGNIIDAGVLLLHWKVT